MQLINLDVSCYVNSIDPDQPIYNKLSDHSLQRFSTLLVNHANNWNRASGFDEALEGV